MLAAMPPWKLLQATTANCSARTMADGVAQIFLGADSVRLQNRPQVGPQATLQKGRHQRFAKAETSKIEPNDNGRLSPILESLF